MTTDLLTAVREALPEGARARRMSDTVINIHSPGRELAKADVDAARAAIIAAGNEEVRSWIAREGMSWLSDGIVSVSFEIRPTD